MNPNGFVAAALMTSQTSRPIRSHSSASWFTNAMFTLRNTFSSNLLSSAASGELISMTLSLMVASSAAARFGAAGGGGRHDLEGLGVGGRERRRGGVGGGGGGGAAQPRDALAGTRRVARVH